MYCKNMIDNKIFALFKTRKEVEDFRDEFNRLCEERINFIEKCRLADDVSRKSFGYIKESFETISPELFNTSMGKTVMNDYVRMIRENKNLSSLHTLYESLRKAGTDTDIESYIHGVSDAEWDIDPKTLEEDVRSLGRILAKGLLLIEGPVNLPEEKAEVDDALMFIAENKRTSKNITEYSNAIKVLKEDISNRKGEIIRNSKKNVNLDGLAESLIKEFNLKYSGQLSDEEIKILKEVSGSDNKEEVFNKYKDMCSNRINEAKQEFEKKGDRESSERLTTVMEQITNKPFVLDTVGEDICSLVELSRIFD